MPAASLVDAAPLLPPAAPDAAPSLRRPALTPHPAVLSPLRARPPQCALSGSGGCVAPPELRATKAAIDKLIKFVALNYLAVVKAIKKRNRHFLAAFGEVGAGAQQLKGMGAGWGQGRGGGAAVQAAPLFLFHA